MIDIRLMVPSADIEEATEALEAMETTAASTDTPFRGAAPAPDLEAPTQICAAPNATRAAMRRAATLSAR